VRRCVLCVSVVCVCLSMRVYVCVCVCVSEYACVCVCCLLSTRSRRCRVITGSVVGLLGVSDVCINTSCALFAVCVC